MEIKECAICGAEPKITTESLYKNGHGYKDSYEYILECPHCKIIKEVSNDIYNKDALNECIKKWNQKNSQIESLIKNNYSIK